MYISELVNITSKALAMPILAQMHAGVPGRQAPLLHATGASRGAFAQSMQHLIDLGYVERNPGHGHPLRPEFRLTAKGQARGAFALEIDRTAQPQHAPLLRRTWALPVLASLAAPRRFGELRSTLHPITDRALSQTLISLEDNAWVSRTVDAESRPPRPLYQPINMGTAISAIATAQITPAS